MHDINYQLHFTNDGYHIKLTFAVNVKNIRREETNRQPITFEYDSV